jgi:hypothetical protein
VIGGGFDFTKLARQRNWVNRLMLLMNSHDEVRIP